MASIRRRKNKWQVQIRRKGCAALSRSFYVLKDAEAWARHMEVQADRRDLPPDPKALERITLRQLVVRYRDSVSVAKRSYEKERFFLRTFLAHPICSKNLSELRTEDFSAYRDERLRTIKPQSIKRELAPIHHLIEIARNEWGLPIRENPLAKLKLNGSDQRRERRLRPGEQDALIRAAKQARNKFVLPVVIVALETAMRRGEILAIGKNHFDPAKRTLLIPESKNGRARTIPLSLPAIELLSKHRARDELLFPFSANAFRLSWERVKRRAGIEDLHFHDLRFARPRIAHRDLGPATGDNASALPSAESGTFSLCCR